MSILLHAVLPASQYEHGTQKAYLFRLPGSDRKFWFPKRLVSYRPGYNASYQLGVPSSMSIRVFRSGEGSESRRVVDEDRLPAQELVTLIQQYASQHD